MDARDFDAPLGKQRTQAHTRLSEPSTAARGLVFDAEQCAVADTDPYSVNVPVDINQSPPGSSRHQTAPNNAKLSRTLFPDPLPSPSAALLQNEAVRRLRKLYCQRSDGSEVLGARYKEVWGSTRQDLDRSIDGRMEPAERREGAEAEARRSL